MEGLPPCPIEKWLPINEVSMEAVRGGGTLAGHPPVNKLYLWWARRPLIASHAAVASVHANPQPPTPTGTGSS